MQSLEMSVFHKHCATAEKTPFYLKLGVIFLTFKLPNECEIVYWPIVQDKIIVFLVSPDSLGV